LTGVQDRLIIRSELGNRPYRVDEQEARAMKRHWPRGLLLGVIVAFLLGGGVALAQSLTVEPDCFQCFAGTSGEFESTQPGYPYSYTWDSCGWDAGQGVYYRETFANGFYYDEEDLVDDEGCVSSEDRWGWTCDGEPAHHAPGTGNDQLALLKGVFPDDYWGTFEICLEPEPDFHASASAVVCDTILFAEDCAAATFVPEAGSILLLGTGLAGLAGYAALRVRSLRRGSGDSLR
jgi:hypothetical protein